MHITRMLLVFWLIFTSSIISSKSHDIKCKTPPIKMNSLLLDIIQDFDQTNSKIHYFESNYFDKDNFMDGIIFLADYYRYPVGQVVYLKGIDYNSVCEINVNSGISFEDISTTKVSVNPEKNSSHGHPEISISYIYVDPNGSRENRIEVYTFNNIAQSFKLKESHLNK